MVSDPRALRLAQRTRLVRYGVLDRLVEAGWSFVVGEVAGSATTNPYTREITVSEKVAKRQSTRDRFYVMEHEMGHALDYEAGGQWADGRVKALGRPSIALGNMIGLGVRDAQEALAEAVAYFVRSSGAERSWILYAMTWRRKRYASAYRWRHVVHPATKELAKMLVMGPLYEQQAVRHYWKWVQVQRGDHQWWEIRRA